MNMPGFAAEASVYKTRNNYWAEAIGASHVFQGVEAAKAKDGFVECTNCPKDRPIPCNGMNRCYCCKYGCERDDFGVASCPPEPKNLIGGGNIVGFPGSGGSVFQ